MDPALETQNVWIHQNDPPENEPITCPSRYFMATFEDDDVRFFFPCGIWIRSLEEFKKRLCDLASEAC